MKCNRALEKWSERNCDFVYSIDTYSSVQKNKYFLGGPLIIEGNIYEVDDKSTNLPMYSINIFKINVQ
jgi:hypothetical protein